jgi:quinol monooxygenase YgiN
MDAGKGFFIARRVIIDKGDATKLPEFIAAKKAALDAKKPEGLHWGVSGLVIGAPTPTALILSHWDNAEHLKAFHETEGFQAQKALVEEWTTQPPQDFKIQLLTDAVQPKSGSVLEVYSYVVPNAERDTLKGEFATQVLPLITGANGFVNLGYGVAHAESADETKIVSAIEWANLEAYQAHHDSEAFKTVVGQFTPKVKDVKNYAVNVA